MIRPEVKTWIGGATVVVAFNPEHYIEASKHPNAPDHQYIQAVRDGQVYLTLTVTGTKGLIVLDDGGANSDDGETKTELWRHEIDFTDTPEGEWKLWLAWDGEHVIVLLPSEY